MINNDNNMNNQVSISGEISSDFSFSHETFGERFYVVNIDVRRKSGAPDSIPVTVSDRLVDVSVNRIGQFASVVGNFRSHNKNDGEKNHLMLSVFAREFSLIEEGNSDENSIHLDGYVCKPPTYRKTPFGREISDLLVAVNRAYGKSDYIPCIAWGRNARFTSLFEVGKRIQIWGRVQSREYEKRISETETETRIAYEVSIKKLEDRNEE